MRKNKILILDEATANVDPEWAWIFFIDFANFIPFYFKRTDFLIQATIRRHFSECTVLTVAHRLNTILDSDRVMVLEAGNIIEFDTPLRLYENATGAFRKLVDDAGLDFEKFRNSHAFNIKSWIIFMYHMKIKFAILTWIDVWSDLGATTILQHPEIDQTNHLFAAQGITQLIFAMRFILCSTFSDTFDGTIDQMHAEYHFLKKLHVHYIMHYC